ncbi:response regulator containing a CheY-like receiver domain and a GGDEF domain [Candidatus Vecturithrix granuli]|uniref:Response regulator containing a CheY-like receiver domain and a GGDEF domain n=1 Tax=Vecturithrix granuli TaxID=1499967 RepID=A0A081C482_VECG1|nr:response regulator containing a CheY-like receiver domain and a GGDEF domain [Candidatus Vecturithrix granuli]
MNNIFPKKLEIFVIDDERDNRIFFRKILENQGFMVLWARDWHEAHQLIATRMNRGEVLPDIVLVDMNFFPPHKVLGENPAMEGVLIIRKLAETCETYGVDIPPVIGFTGKEDYMQKQEMVQAGVSDFITTEEYKNPQVLGRRLLQCIQEFQTVRMLQAPSEQAIRAVEEKIVHRALQLHKQNIEKAAEFLNWEIKEVITIERRLQKYANS